MLVWQCDAIECVVAGTVGVDGEGSGGVEKQAAQPSRVLAEDAEDLLLGDPTVALDAGVEVGHEGDRGVTEGEFPGENRLRISSHVYDSAAHSGVPAGFGAGRKPRSLDHDHRASVDEWESGALGDGPHRGPAGWTVRVGEVHMDRTAVVVGVVPGRRAINELIRHNESAGAQVGAEPSDGAGREHLAYADLAERPEVGPVRNPMRWITVISAVSGKEGDMAATDLGHRDWV